ncbi:Periplasmic serine endoprotease DegP precursor [Rosistilla carotiformis]|uniref:Periplasmic serine endoprotease DegP n=1 Tax=Rosistilla carotiformis TaxID=2528017 RepID=A0A518JLB9_9BACT|nr:trypsin-like peptidase domain-containing protein [Rosistilla carotiformis]QDV66338.1 Periplasmic serine endoprotease DegP precursor [Rosistilla carotiformis]
MRQIAFLVVILFSACPTPAQQPPDALLSMQSALTNAIDRAGRSVVAIARVRKDLPADAMGDLKFNLPGLGRPLIDPSNPAFVPTEFASGVIVSADGDVLTNFHVLDDPKQNDYYVWHRGIGSQAVVQATPAEVLAGDPWTDLAILRIENAKDLPAIKMGDASQIQRGMFVISLGNPYAIARDGYPSASMGIVSNLQRAAAPRPDKESRGQAPPSQQLHEFGTLIQTDAKLNLGTSGGALVNLQGEMIGLTTSLAAVAGYEQSAGFAIPIDKSMRAAIDKLREGKTPAFGFLGLEPADLPEPQRARGLRGAIVRQVLQGMPAQRAGLRSGDLITKIDGQPIDGAAGLFREMSRRPANAHVQMTLLQGNPLTDDFQSKIVDVTLGKKYLALTKPGYSRFPEPSWRGLRVDHGTALPPGQLFGFSRPREILPVAVISVDPGTPAWNAGLRPGQFVQKVGDKSVPDPDTFYELVKEQTDAVALTIVGPGDREQRISVPTSIQ